MRVLGESLKARYYELLDQSYPFPEGGYEGDYIKDIAKAIIKENGEKLLSHNEDNNIFRSFAEKHIFENIKETLDSLGLQFDNYFNENQLYENKKIYEVINRLKEKDLIYEKDNATWFKTSELGLPADRVLIKSTGEPTYRLPDIAYHMTKFERGFDMCVDIFGADHMDAYPDVLAALNQLDFNDKDVKVLIHQFVSIVNHGDVVKMSTRKGNFITLERLIKDVGIDVVRYFFIMRSINSHLNFDLEIAKEKSENNPVYYIQYAHARICTILEKYNSENNALDVNLDLLEQDTEIKLIYKMVEFEELILKLGSNLEPQILANYLFDLATSLHKYYAHHKIISDNAELSVARIYLINCIRIVIRNGLTILGIGCPKKM
jgi:arginyl-tRNA synthetase